MRGCVLSEHANSDGGELSDLSDGVCDGGGDSDLYGDVEDGDGALFLLLFGKGVGGCRLGLRFGW